MLHKVKKPSNNMLKLFKHKLIKLMFVMIINNEYQCNHQVLIYKLIIIRVDTNTMRIYIEQVLSTS